jgi:anti-sigma B factor antagonist
MARRLHEVRTTARDDAYGEPFRAEVEARGGTTSIRLSGAFGSECESEVRRLIASAAATSTDRIVLDLTRLTFLDSAGLRVVLEVGAASRARGLEFAVIPGTGPVRRVLELNEALREITLLDEPAMPGGRQN